jgi:hypothetical protein
MSILSPTAWQVSEEFYLESANDEVKKKYAEFGDTDKKVILRGFVTENAAPTTEGKKWTRLLLDMLRD